MNLVQVSPFFVLRGMECPYWELCPPVTAVTQDSYKLTGSAILGSAHATQAGAVVEDFTLNAVPCRAAAAGAPHNHIEKSPFILGPTSMHHYAPICPKTKEGLFLYDLRCFPVAAALERLCIR